MAIGHRAADRLWRPGRPPTGPRGRVLRWAARLLAVGLVACGVVLTIDGVLAV